MTGRGGRSGARPISTVVDRAPCGEMVVGVTVAVVLLAACGASQSDSVSVRGTPVPSPRSWMLHAWVVPGWENRWGNFAIHNPALCPKAAGTPDIRRCPAG
jgi:hypothetical protein